MRSTCGTSRSSTLDNEGELGGETEVRGSVEGRDILVDVLV